MASGNDPRGRTQDEYTRQQTRYEDQQGPMANAMAYNYGRASEANYGDYTDVMNQYRGIASGGGSASGGGGGGGYGGGGGFQAAHIGYKDPFNSYAGFQDFSTTGGYSRNDIANMRSRGVSPIRAAYANAEREMSRQRSLQGGYSPNAFANLTKMAREQSQGAADATQAVEAGLAEARNKGRLSGLAGMSDIEKQRLAADLDVSKFNANADMSAGASQSAAASSNADRAMAADAASMNDRFRALSGMTTMYGATPGMSQLFGNQLLSATGQGATQGAAAQGNLRGSQQLPGAFDQTMGRATGMIDLAGRVANPIMEAWEARNQRNRTNGSNPNYNTP